MVNRKETDDKPPPASQLADVDAICEEFEQAWEFGLQPRVEEYLGKLTEDRRELLLRYLIPLEIEQRRKQGETIRSHEFAERFPGDVAVVREALASCSGIEESQSKLQTQSYAQASQSDTHSQAPGSDGQPEAKPKLPKSIGRYEITGWLGRGAFGNVYRGRDPELGRDVAIKVWRGAKQHVAGLMQEARTVAQLKKHPHVVSVYDVGKLKNGQCYVVFEFIDGCTLSDRLRSSPNVPLADSLKIASQVVAAIGHAHAADILHRDLKPPNILIDRSGNAHVTDFGLAIDHDSQRHRDGEISGTPAYMAPEQTRGETGLLDGRADIWAVGVILYEMLAGRRPFDGGDRVELFAEIQQRPPTPLRQLNPSVPAAVEKVCLKCLEKNPHDRHASAADLSAALQSSQIDPVLRRKRRMQLGATACLLVLLVLLLPFVWPRDYVSRPVIVVYAGAKHELSPAGVSRVHTSVVSAAVFGARSQVASGGDDRMLKLWDGDVTGAVGDVLEIEEVDYEGELAGKIRGLAISPAKDVLASGASDHSVVLWNPVGLNRTTLSPPHDGDVRSVAFSPDGSRLISGSTDETIRLWDVESKCLLETFANCGSGVHCVKYSPDGATIAAACHDGNIRLYATADGTLENTLVGHDDRVTHVAFSPDGRLLASCGRDGTARIWDLGTKKQIQKIDAHRGVVYAVLFFADGSEFVTAGEDRRIRSWDVKTGELQQEVKAHGGPVMSLDISEDGTRVASASTDSLVRLWIVRPTSAEPVVPPPNIKKPTATEPLASPYSLGDFVQQNIKLDADVLSGLVASPSPRVGAARWQIEAVFPRRPITCVAWSPDGKLFACGTDVGRVRVYDRASGQLVQYHQLAPYHVVDIAWHPNDGRLAALCRGILHVWEPDGTLAKSVDIEDRYTYRGAIAWSPDGEILAIACGKIIMLWRDGDESPNRIGETIMDWKNAAMSVAWRNDSSQIASGHWDGTIIVWAADGTRVVSIDGHEATKHNPNGVMAVDWSRDNRIVSSGSDKTVRTWEASGQAGPMLNTTEIAMCAGWMPNDNAVWYFENGTGLWTWPLHEEPQYVDGSPREHIRSNPRAGKVDGKTGEFAICPRAVIRTTSLNRSKTMQLRQYWSRPDQVACSPNGRQIAVSMEVPPVTHFIEANGITHTSFLDHEATAMAIDWSADGNLLATSAYGGSIQVRHADGTNEKSYSLGKGDTSITWHPDSRHLAIGKSDGQITIKDIHTDQETRFPPGNNPILDLAWRPDGSCLLSVDSAATLTAWTHSGTVLWQTSIGNGYSRQGDGLAWHPNGNQFNIRDQSNALRFYDIQGKYLNRVDDAGPFDWRPDGKQIAVGVGVHGPPYGLALLNEEGEAENTLFSPVLDPHMKHTQSLSWNADNCRLVSAGRDATIVSWDTKPADGSPPKAEWVGLLMDDGEAITIDAAGNILHGKDEIINNRLVYIVEHPDGSTELLKRAAFEARYPHKTN